MSCDIPTCTTAIKISTKTTINNIRAVCRQQHLKDKGAKDHQRKIGNALAKGQKQV